MKADAYKRSLKHKADITRIHETPEDLTGVDWDALPPEARKLLDSYDKDYDFSKHPKKIYRKIWHLMVKLDHHLKSIHPLPHFYLTKKPLK